MKIRKWCFRAVLPVIMACVMLFGMVGCSQNRFMSDGELLKNVGTLKGTIVLRMENEYGRFPSEDVQWTLPFELYYDKAPITVTNFVNLYEQGYWDYTKFEDNLDENGLLKNAEDCLKPIVHRLSKAKNFFLIQMGGYREIQRGTSFDLEELGELDYTIKGEFAENGWDKNSDLSHVAGVMSMARKGDFDSASNQFFITLGDCADTLDGKYAAFGKVLEIPSHMQYLKDQSVETKTLLNGSTSFENFPVQKITIVSVTLDLRGIKFPKALHLPKAKSTTNQ